MTDATPAFTHSLSGVTADMLYKMAREAEEREKNEKRNAKEQSKRKRAIEKLLESIRRACDEFACELAMALVETERHGAAERAVERRETAERQHEQALMIAATLYEIGGEDESEEVAQRRRALVRHFFGHLQIANQEATRADLLRLRTTLKKTSSFNRSGTLEELLAFVVRKRAEISDSIEEEDGDGDNDGGDSDNGDESSSVETASASAALSESKKLSAAPAGCSVALEDVNHLRRAPVHALAEVVREALLKIEGAPTTRDTTIFAAHLAHTTIKRARAYFAYLSNEDLAFSYLVEALHKFDYSKANVARPRARHAESRARHRRSAVSGATV